MRRVMTALLAAALLVGGGAAFALVASQDAAVAQEEPSTETDEPDVDVERPDRSDVFGDVLGDLVDEGVITQEQADSITDAFEERLVELRARFEEHRDEFRSRGRGFFHRGFHLGALLEDGVIDADELAELGEDHPLNDPDGPAAEYLDDGQLTQEELEELRAELMPDGLHRRFPFGNPPAGESDAAEGLFSG